MMANPDADLKAKKTGQLGATARKRGVIK